MTGTAPPGRRAPARAPLLARGGFARVVLASWLAVLTAGAALAGAGSYARLAADFEAQARTLHRVVSQRADQHDAFLTSLSAVLLSPDAPLPAARAVAGAVQRFYPRVTAVDVVAFAPVSRVPLTLQEPSPGGPDTGAVADAVRALSPGQSVLIVPGAGGMGYVLAKRLPPGPAGVDALALRVDTRRLMEPEAALPPGTGLALDDARGRPIHRGGTGGTGGSLLPAFVFEKALGSRSQPLVLRLARTPALAEVFTAGPMLAVALAGGAAVGLGALVARARRAAREAGSRASLSEHEARLAHAMRVNAVGEMASGIAHELTQPLTAVLSQSQAGLRLAHAAPGTPEAVIAALEANVRHAKRAGAILSRLRAHVSPREPRPEPTALNACVRGVAELVRRDLDARGIALTLEPDPADPWCRADPVSVEQVVHNLVRNAADAVQNLPEPRRAVRVSTAAEGAEAVVRVSDDGEGVAPEHLPRLFEPFFTTKPDGMGLGLSLCERLVEAAGGRIGVRGAPGAGTTVTVRLPLLARGAARAA